MGSGNINGTGSTYIYGLDSNKILTPSGNCAFGAALGNATYTYGNPTVANQPYVYDINPNACTFSCSAGYSYQGGVCVSSLVTGSCTNLPANAVFTNSSSSYGLIDAPQGTPLNAVTAGYAVSPTVNTCEFKCSAGYLWNGSSCFAAAAFTSRTYNAGEYFTYNGTIFSVNSSNSATSQSASVGCDTMDKAFFNATGTIVVMKMCNEGASTVFNGQSYPANVAPNAGQISYMGDYYQWGNIAKLTTVGTSPAPISTIGYGNGTFFSNNTFITGNQDWSSNTNNDLWGDVSNDVPARRGMCPIGYHIPSQTEWFTAINLVSPMVGNMSSFQMDSLAAVNAFKLPASGYRHLTGNYAQQGTMGFYSTSSYNGTVAQYAIAFNVGSQQINPMYNIQKAYGFNVRCFKN